jgi:hypothetical protein
VRRALVLVLLAALAGCGSSSSGSTSSTTPKASGGAPAALGPTFDDIGTLPGAQKTAPPWDNGGTQLRARLKAIGLPPLPQEGTVIHIHQHLDVYVDGKKVTVPALIGIGESGGQPFFAELHTHDPTGIMHVESATQSQFTLGQFFAVWGVPLSANGIGSLKGPVHAWVGGKPLTGDPTRIILAPHQEIVLAYGAAPKKIPSTYEFPQGL